MMNRNSTLAMSRTLMLIPWILADARETVRSQVAIGLEAITSTFTTYHGSCNSVRSLAILHFMLLFQALVWVAGTWCRALLSSLGKGVGISWGRSADSIATKMG